MKFTAALVSVTLASVAAAQTNNSELGVEAIEAHFSQSGIVPSLLATFDPVGVLSLNYAGVGDISPGQPLTKDRTCSPRCQGASELMFLACRGRSCTDPGCYPRELDSSVQRELYPGHGRCRSRRHG